MSLADMEFKSMCEDVLANGTSSEGQQIRAKWADGSPAHTTALFGVVNRFDLSKEFPALTLRKTPIKTATEEMLWIWQKKSNNINDLAAHVWDQWADETGSIGKAYGYQLGLKHRCKDVTEEGLKKVFPNYKFYDVIASQNLGLFSNLDHTFDPNELRTARVCQDVSIGRIAAIYDTVQMVWYMDQVDKVLYDLINNPFSRRIMTTLWEPADLDDMNLQPCAWNCTFMVEQRPDHDKLTLNMYLHQRSQDILAAWAFNTAQYAVLQHMLAQVCDMEVGMMIHSDVNCHIYDRHVPAVKELISREPKPAPEFWLNPFVKDFYAFTKDDVELRNYEVAGPQITDIEVAV